MDHQKRIKRVDDSFPGWEFRMGLQVLPLPGETDDLWRTARMTDD